MLQTMQLLILRTSFKTHIFVEEDAEEENIQEMHDIIQFTIFHYSVFLQKYERLNYTFTHYFLQIQNLLSNSE